MNLIFTICDIIEENYLVIFLNYSISCFENNRDIRNNKECDWVHKESLLWLIGSLSDIILKDQNLISKFEILFEKYILPELNSQIGFLRLRACWLLEKFGHIDFIQEYNLKVILIKLKILKFFLDSR